SCRADLSLDKASSWFGKCYPGSVGSVLELLDKSQRFIQSPTSSAISARSTGDQGMDDRTQQLRSLAIDRGGHTQAPARRAGRGMLVAAVLAVVLVLAGAALWFTLPFSSAGAPESKVTETTPPATAPAAAATQPT